VEGGWRLATFLARPDATLAKLLLSVFSGLSRSALSRPPIFAASQRLKPGPQSQSQGPPMHLNRRRQRFLHHSENTVMALGDLLDDDNYPSFPLHSHLEGRFRDTNLSDILCADSSYFFYSSIRAAFIWVLILCGTNTSYFGQLRS
jgi:hypothetical protein